MKAPRALAKAVGWLVALQVGLYVLPLRLAPLPALMRTDP